MACAAPKSSPKTSSPLLKHFPSSSQESFLSPQSSKIFWDKNLEEEAEAKTLEKEGRKRERETKIPGRHFLRKKARGRRGNEGTKKNVYKSSPRTYFCCLPTTTLINMNNMYVGSFSYNKTCSRILGV